MSDLCVEEIGDELKRGILESCAILATKDNPPLRDPTSPSSIPNS